MNDLDYDSESGLEPQMNDLDYDSESEPQMNDLDYDSESVNRIILVRVEKVSANICMYVCMYVCMYGRVGHTKTTKLRKIFVCVCMYVF
jgi:hypothetical protein